MTNRKLKLIEYILFATANASTAKKLKVGVLLMDEDRVIANAYNGTLPGAHNRCEDTNGKTLEVVLHAEDNLIAFCAKNGISMKGKDVYITHTPCIHCAILLISAGIKSITIFNEYKNTIQNHMFLYNGIGVEYVRKVDTE